MLLAQSTSSPFPLLQVIACVMLAMGLFASGYPQHEILSSLKGQLVGIAVMIGVGFVPGYLISLVLDRSGLFRVSREVAPARRDLPAPGRRAVGPGAPTGGRPR